MFEKVQAIIAKELGIEKDQVKLDSRLAEDLLLFVKFLLFFVLFRNNKIDSF